MRSRAVAAAGLFAVLASAAVAAATGAAPLRLVEPGDGRDVNLAFDVPATHIVFFATWCPPCVEELEELTRFAARWEERGYRLVLVAVRNRQSPEKLNAFSARVSVPGRLFFDADGSVQRRYDVVDLPTHVVLDSGGAEVARGAGMGGSVANALASLLADGRPARRR